MNQKPSDFGGLFVDGDQISRNLMRRLVVVGANGAGKTWFAERLGLPVIHKDALALTTGWQQHPRADVQDAIARLILADKWVLEGGSSVLTPQVLERADLVIWLDLPAPLRFWRVVRRSVRYAGRVRPEHPAGNRDWPGLRQWRFAWRSLTAGARVAEAIETSLTGAGVPVLRLRSSEDVLRFFVLNVR